MEFRSFNMRARSPSVSSRCARSATYETSFSVTMTCPLQRRLFEPVLHHKLDGVDRLRANWPQGCKILPAKSLKLLLPGGIGNFDRQHSIGVANGACLLRHLSSASQRPTQQRRIVARFPAHSAGKYLLQYRAGVLHDVETPILASLVAGLRASQMVCGNSRRTKSTASSLWCRVPSNCASSTADRMSRNRGPGW